MFALFVFIVKIENISNSKMEERRGGIDAVIILNQLTASIKNTFMRHFISN
jgi:hypothetical protein